MRPLLALLSCLLPCLLPWAGATAEPLPPLAIDRAKISVSGLSSGGYMAVQLQTAHGEDIMGAAVFAGGPFGCAAGATGTGSLTQAAMHCVNLPWMWWNPFASFLGPPDVDDLVALTRALAGAGRIAPVDTLADDRVYLFSGANDATVPPPVMTALRDWYRAFVPESAVEADFGTDAGHGFPVIDSPVPCAATAPPYLNDCDFSGARKALEAIYGPLTPGEAADGTLRSFDQSLFVPDDGPAYHGLNAQGRVFIPDRCTAGGCALHIAFHGCQQTEAQIGEAWWRATAYTRWAAANGIVVLFPQARASTPSLFNPFAQPNPRGCWDWWGYTGAEYLTRDGVQIRAVWAMVERLAAPLD